MRFHSAVINADEAEMREHVYLRCCVAVCCCIIAYTLKLTSMPSKAVVKLLKPIMF